MRQWILAGTVAQIAMVLVGHWVEFVRRDVFAIGGILISGIAAALFARAAHLSRGRSALYGAVVGGVSALIGIALCVALGDTQPIVLAFGTASSTVAGAIGGALARPR